MSELKEIQVETAHKKMSTSLAENMSYLGKELAVNESFDLVYRVIRMAGREACLYQLPREDCETGTQCCYSAFSCVCSDFCVWR